MYAFLLSMFFHIIFFTSLYYFYTLFSKKEHIDEKMISVKLSELVRAQEKIVTPQSKKQPTEKKIQKEIKPPFKKKVQKVEKKAEVKKLKPIVQPKPQIKVEKVIQDAKPVDNEPEAELPQEIVKDENKIEKLQEKEEVQKEIVKEPLITEAQRQKQLESEFLDENMVKITKLLQENLYYPRSARKRGITGEISVVFCINTNGVVTDVKVEQSNSAILSRAAKKTIINLSGEFPRPKEKLILHLPISYRLD